MWAQLRRFNALSGAAKALLLRAILLLPFITISLKLSGFQRTQKRLQSFIDPRAPTKPPQASDSRVELISRMVLAAARHSPTPSTCLERALAIWWLLGRQGIASQLRIGVRKESGKFQAHAWVERDGSAIGELESSHLHYSAFDENFSGETS
jgi:hypothetical protein